MLHRAIVCFLLLVVGRSLSLRDPDDQWSGNCYQACGKKLDQYCEQETRRCNDCAVWCLSTQDFAGDEECHQHCPAFWADIHRVVITTTIEADTTISPPTSKSTTHFAGIQTKENNTTSILPPTSSSSHLTSPNLTTPVSSQFNWWVLALVISIFLGLCLIAAGLIIGLCRLCGNREKEINDPEYPRPVTTTGEGKSEGSDGYHILAQEETSQEYPRPVTTTGEGKSEGSEGYHILEQENQEQEYPDAAEDRIQDEYGAEDPKTDQTSRFNKQLPFPVPENGLVNTAKETCL